MSNCCDTCTHHAAEHDEEPCIHCCVNQSRVAGGCRPMWEAKGGAPAPVTVHETILQEAQRLVHGDRGADYGHPLDDFTKTATMFNALKGTHLTAEDVAVFMICVKLSRLENKFKRDSLVDIAGYAETVSMVVTERERRSNEGV